MVVSPSKSAKETVQKRHSNGEAKREMSEQYDEAITPSAEALTKHYIADDVCS